MVRLDKIYTRTGDKGETRLSTGEVVPKWHPRVTAYGTVDELNAALGVAALEAKGDMLARIRRIQNDLFDLGADLATPETGEDLGYTPLRIVAAQVDKLERDIDTLNAGLKPLRSFVLPAGTPAAAHLHVARTVCRRAERMAVELSATLGEFVGPESVKYLNRLSDLLFVMSRLANARAAGDGKEGDVLWVPAAGRE